MPKRRELSESERSRILLLSEEGLSQVAIAKRLKCSRCAVQTTIKRVQETGELKIRPGRGRKRKTTDREDRWLCRQALVNRRQSARNLTNAFQNAHNITLSPRTIARRLGEVGLKARRPRKKPYLSEVNRRKRVAWAEKHKNWTVEEWEKVLWSDESNIQVCGFFGRSG